MASNVVDAGGHEYAWPCLGSSDSSVNGDLSFSARDWRRRQACHFRPSLSVQMNFDTETTNATPTLDRLNPAREIPNRGLVLFLLSSTVAARLEMMRVPGAQDDLPVHPNEPTYCLCNQVGVDCVKAFFITRVRSP